MPINLSFLGGAGTVTGSKYALECGATRLLVDCGLFQSFKSLRLKNWAPLAIPPGSVNAVILTHPHLDHSGYALADADEILRWLHGFRTPPKMTFITHGEPVASDELRHRIEEELGWPCMVPDHGQRCELS